MAKVLVSQIFELLQDVYSQPQPDIADEIAKTAAPLSGGESDPTRETIMNYTKPPARVTIGNKSVLRKNRETPLHYKFAHLVLNYLDGRRPKNKHSEVPRWVKQHNSWLQARMLCKKILVGEREKRFAQALAGDAGMQENIESLRGVFVTCRRESIDDRLRQELLILNNDGTESASRCHCTYITDHAVNRGQWVLVGSSIHCGLGGYHGDNTLEHGSLYLAYESTRDILSGYLAGTGTGHGQPVAMPMVAVRVPGHHPSVERLGDLGDEDILRAFRSIKIDLSDIDSKMKAILPPQSESTVFNVLDAQKRLRASFESSDTMIHRTILNFCQSIQA